MNKLSNGLDSTLGNWYDLTKSILGDDSPATAFLQNKITNEGGRDVEVIADEGQLLRVLLAIHTNKTPEGTLI